jgi:hypothetical protein
VGFGSVVGGSVGGTVGFTGATVEVMGWGSVTGVVAGSVGTVVGAVAGSVGAVVSVEEGISGAVAAVVVVGCVVWWISKDWSGAAAVGVVIKHTATAAVRIKAVALIQRPGFR